MVSFSGVTPQRRPFNYPRDLVRTEDHDVLITRFRKENDLPILELDDEEEVKYHYVISQAKPIEAIMQEINDFRTKTDVTNMPVHRPTID